MSGMLSWKRICSVVLAVLLLAAAGAALAEDEVVSGTCGTDAAWTLDEAGVLTISGTGPMDDYAGWNAAPWKSYQSRIVTVVIEEGITKIGDMAFISMSSLESVTIPNTVEYIGMAFMSCNLLTEVTIPASVTEMHPQAFFWNKGLTAIHVAQENPSYTSVDGVLYNKDVTTFLYCPCGRIEHVIIPDTVTSIGRYAFSDTMSQTEISIPAGVTTIATRAFEGCLGLLRFSVDGQNASFVSEEGVLLNRSGTELIAYPAGNTADAYTVPDGVNTLASYSFAYAQNLKDVILPDSVASIGAYAFYECANMERITIPESVTSIEDHVFQNCNVLTIVCKENSAAYDYAISNGISWLPPEEAVLIDENTFPDENFRDFVRGFDGDEDGSLSGEEIAAVMGIACAGQGIESLEGIGVFTNLQALSCANNRLTALDVSGLPLLSELYCSYNQITLLDVSGCPALCAAMQQNTRTSQYGSAHWSYYYEVPDKFGESFTFDYFTTVTDGETVSYPVMNTPGGSGENEITIPEVLALGRNLDIQLRMPEGAEHTVLYLYYMNGDVPEYLYARYVWAGSGSSIIHTQIDYNDCLLRTGEYRLLADTTYEDRNIPNAVTVKGFTVTGTRPDAPQVSVASEEIIKDSFAEFDIGPGTAQAGQQVETIRYLITDNDGDTSEGYIYSGVHLDNGHIRYQAKQYYTGEKTYSFSVRINGIWSEYSVPVMIRCVSLGQMDPPDYAAAPASLAAGEPLYVDLGPAEGIRMFSVQIQGGDNYIHTTEIYGSGSQEFIKFGLEAGSYTVRFKAYADGYDESEWTNGKPLTVTGSRPALPQEGFVSYPEGTYYGGDRVWVTVSAEGLEALTEDYSWADVYQCDGSTGYYPITAAWPDWGEPRYLRAKINGRWTDPFEVFYQGEEEEENDDWLLDVSNFPESILLGQALQFSSELPEGAETYTFSISYIIHEDEEYKDTERIVYEYLHTPDGNGNWTIPAQFFTNAGNYDICVNARGSGVYKECTRKLTVAENTNIPAAPTVTLLTENPRLYEDVSILISAPGATQASIIVKSAYDQNQVILNPFTIDMDDGEYEFVFNQTDYGLNLYDMNDADYVLRASVFNGTVWSAYSEPVRITYADTTGELQPPSEDMFHMDPEEPAAGDVISVSWDDVQGAEKYQIVLDWEETIYTGDAADSHACTLDTAGLAIGVHYLKLNAFAVGKYGCESMQRFVLLDPAAKPTVQAKNTVAENGEPISLTIRTTKYDFVLIYVDGELYTRSLRDASGTQQAVLRLGSGSHTITARTGDGPDEPLSTASDPLTVLVGEACAVTVQGVRVDGETEPLVPGDDGYYTVITSEDVLISFSAPDMAGYTKSYRFGRGDWWEEIPETEAGAGIVDYPVRLRADGNDVITVTAWAVWTSADPGVPELTSACDIRFHMIHDPDCGVRISGPTVYNGDAAGYPVTVQVPDTTMLIRNVEWAIEVFDCDAFDRVYTINFETLDLHNGTNVFYIPADQLTGSGSYFVGFWFEALGYDWYTDSLYFVNQGKAAILQLPAGVTRIEDEAFAGGAFQAVVIPDGCTYIGHNAFANCSQLIYLSYPTGCEFETDTFSGCSVRVWDERK